MRWQADGDTLITAGGNQGIDVPRVRYEYPTDDLRVRSLYVLYKDSISALYLLSPHATPDAHYTSPGVLRIIGKRARSTQR
ncbi:hypothetical protein [Paraflavitalea pollutisoli]|uniref:hypothetical protein n=1 Tax=Paraflavitalea pollutisoli TaxID=3034143 RepID=UPI0023EB2BF8|nr:hypothetical protein [Paraflavitalea sp. H1-2-19X]